MYLFGYGSLLNLQSAQKSFKRTLSQDDLIEVNIKGYEKVWNSIEHISFVETKEDIDGIFLNLDINQSKQTNGVLIKIDEEELRLLKLREKNYTCIQINPNDILNFQTNEKIYSFMTTNVEKIATTINDKTFIPQKYIDLLTTALFAYDDNFKKEFLKCMDNLPFKIKKGEYKFSDPIQNKFAKEGFNGRK